jgi:hypothetical protein
MGASLGVFYLELRVGDGMQGTRVMATSSGTAKMAHLYSAFAPGAARLAYLLTGDQHLAEDFVQEAFLRMLGRFEYLRKPESFQASGAAMLSTLRTSRRPMRSGPRCKSCRTGSERQSSSVSTRTCRNNKLQSSSTVLRKPFDHSWAEPRNRSVN